MITKIIKTFIYKIYMITAISLFNKGHDVQILSYQASMKADYGRKVRVDVGTVITSDVKIGYASYINVNSHIENCVIGNYCSISDNVSICPAEHNIDLVLSHPILGNKKTRKVIIGNDVLVSHNVTILQGVKIGDGAIIGAGAVVTKNVKPYTIVGGVPARFIRNRFDNDRKIKIIKKYDLYNLQEKQIEELEKKRLLDKV